MRVTNEQELNELIAQVKVAQEAFARFSQEQVDRIFHQAARAANEARIPLAKMAVEETGMGVVEDKVIKNHFAAEMVYNKYKDLKTCGVIEEDPHFGLKKNCRTGGDHCRYCADNKPNVHHDFQGADCPENPQCHYFFSPPPR